MTNTNGSNRYRKILGIPLVIITIITLLLYIQAPHLFRALRYQFAGIDDHQIFPNAIVKSGAPQPWVEATNYNQTQLNPRLLTEIESYEPVAFLVIQNEEIVYEQYWEEHEQNSVSASFSMAKSIVSLLVGVALEEGKIESLDQPIGDFIPEFKVGEKQKITFRHLLTMTSGLDWEEAYTSPLSPTTELYYGYDLYGLVANLSIEHEPGTVWYYSSADTQLLGIALEAAIGQPLNSYASEKLWIPLGAEQDASWSLDRDDGIIKGNCCFNSTARDFARLGQLVLQKGEWEGQQLVPAAYLDEAVASIRGIPTEEGERVNFYGYQFWLAPLNNQPVPFFRGILGQYIFVIPHLDAVVVRLGHRDDPNLEDVRTYLRATTTLLEQSSP